MARRRWRRAPCAFSGADDGLHPVRRLPAPPKEPHDPSRPRAAPCGSSFFERFRPKSSCFKVMLWVAGVVSSRASHGPVLQGFPGRGRCRALGGQQGRQPRQCVGRWDQRAIQGRIDLPPRAVKNQRGGRTGRRGMGSLVQQPSPARTHRLHSIGRWLRQTTKGKLPVRPTRWRPDSTQRASRKLGAVQIVTA